MSQHSSNLNLPYLQSGQAQKHVTVNESLRKLDALVQLAVVSATTSAQPGSPTDGQAYILPAGKTGAQWGAMTNLAIAYYVDGAWMEITPREGFTAFVKDTDELLIYSGSAWLSHSTANARKLLFTPGGDGVVSIYRIETLRVQNPRTATISSISGDVITVSAAVADTFYTDAFMKNVSYARIWNISKSPEQAAWVKAQPANNQLQVVSAAALTGWANGETIQIGDPASVTPNRCIALDISPMLQAVLGRVFRQSGVLCKVAAQSNGVQSDAVLSEAGATGSFNGVKSFVAGEYQATQVTIPCSVLSPISNSNLVFLRETVSGANFAQAAASVIGVWV